MQEKIEIFKKYLVGNLYAENTVMSYCSDVLQFLNFCKNTFDDGIKIENQHIRLFLIFLYEKKSKPSHINRKLSSLRTYFHYLEQYQGYANPPDFELIQKIKNPKRLPSFFSEKEMEAVLTKATFEESLMVELFYSTGIRVSELQELRWQNLDLTSSKVKVFGKGSRERIIPLNKNLEKKLSHFKSEKRAKEDDFVFQDKHKNATNRFSIYRKIRKLFYYSSPQKKSPHIIRHSFATHLLNRGAPIMNIKKLLGHQNLSTTQIYTQVHWKKMLDNYQKNHPRAKEKSKQ